MDHLCRGRGVGRIGLVFIRDARSFFYPWFKKQYRVVACEHITCTELFIRYRPGSSVRGIYPRLHFIMVVELAAASGERLNDYFGLWIFLPIGRFELRIENSFRSAIQIRNPKSTSNFYFQDNN